MKTPKRQQTQRLQYLLIRVLGCRASGSETGSIKVFFMGCCDRSVETPSTFKTLSGASNGSYMDPSCSRSTS